LEPKPVPLSLPSSALLIVAAVLTAVGGVAQQVRAVVPIGTVGPPAAAPQAADDDPGPAVEMFENPNLDRYLRRAQSFLDRADYGQAIAVLQDVIEGRTVEVVGGEGATSTPPAAGEATPADQAAPAPAKPRRGAPDGQPAAPAPRPRSLDARNSVFSADGRLYRPVRRLCHELLSRMPAVGIESYRSVFEVAAEEQLLLAQREGSLSRLEQVVNRYFVTLAAGRAMAELADRLMHEGRHRAAVQVLRDLLDIYPADNRRRLGISEPWCRFKIALCLRLGGELEAAATVVKQLAADFPDDSLRVLGELQTIAAMPGSELFARDLQAVPIAPGDEVPSWLAADTEDLIPLWQYRFRNPEPYKDPKTTNNERVWFGEGVTTAKMPYASRYGPATWVTFSRDTDGAEPLSRALFLEHFRLRLADTGSGVLLGQGLTNADQGADEPDEPPPARENQPRVRYAASDHALLRPVEDESRRYVVLGQPRASSSLDVLKVSQLVAYRRDLQKREWSSAQWLDGDSGLRDVTFLAAPVVFGETLLLPALRRGAYTLECLDRRTGQPLWHTLLHAGGTSFFKAPGTAVVVQSGTAFVATNAGCIAAVDAYVGDLRWVRRYERVDPLRRRPRPKASKNDEMMQFQNQFQQGELPGFLANDLVARNGLVVLAACDSEMLLCFDAANGEPVWMLDATTRYASYGRLRTLVGADAESIYLAADNHVVAVGLAGGLVRWARELSPLVGPKHLSRGRGLVLGNHVVMPGQRQLFVVPTDGRSPVRTLTLPAFDSSREPLAGSFNLVADGAWLAAGFQGGVELFSSSSALQQVAARTGDPLRRAIYLVQAGRPEAAIEALTTALRRELPTELRSDLGSQLLALVREQAARLAKAGDTEAALRCLDAVRELLVDRTVRLNWHLARIEICKEAADLRAHEREQQRLYDYMEGRG
jgi:tetratricopeptide (TPR) repeat protein